MQLFHFTSTEYALQAIRNRRLKVARIDELNDPFELLAPVSERREHRIVVNRWKRQMSERFGMICLSARWRHPLQWGHYADKHKGICLGFEVLREQHFRKVEYVRKRPNITELGAGDLGGMNKGTMERLLFLKFSAWRYEAEFRAFVDLKKQDSESGLYFGSFAPALRLNRVIVGHRSPATRADVAEALGNPKGVKAFLSRPGFHKFEVVQNMDKSAWH